MIFFSKYDIVEKFKKIKSLKVGYKTLIEPCQIFDNWFNLSIFESIIVNYI